MKLVTSNKQEWMAVRETLWLWRRSSSSSSSANICFRKSRNERFAMSNHHDFGCKFEISKREIQNQLVRFYIFDDTCNRDWQRENVLTGTNSPCSASFCRSIAFSFCNHSCHRNKFETFIFQIWELAMNDSPHDFLFPKFENIRNWNGDLSSRAVTTSGAVLASIPAHPQYAPLSAPCTEFQNF